MQFIVSDMRLVRTDNERVVQGEEQMAYFRFDASWDKSVKTAGFIRDGDVVYHAAIVDGACLVPPSLADVPSFGVVVFRGGMRRTNPVEIAVEPNPLSCASILPPSDLYGDMHKRLLKLEEEKQNQGNKESQHIANSQNPHGVTKEQVGLGHADDTADADKPLSHAMREALEKKSDKENFCLIGENITAKMCYDKLSDVYEIDDTQVWSDAEGTLVTTAAINPNRIVHVTANGYTAIGLGANFLSDGEEAAVHCDNAQGMQINILPEVYYTNEVRAEYLLLVPGDIILFRCVGDRTYLIPQKSVAFFDGTQMTILPHLKHSRFLGDMIYENARDFLHKPFFYKFVYVSGEFYLEENGHYALELNDDCEFVLPEKTTGETDGRIEMILNIPYEYKISFGDVLYPDGAVPMFSYGCYRVVCVYDVIYGKWCISATEYREDWSEALGLRVDYENCVFERLEAATGKTAGADFDAYSMYGGRKRCNVADDGTILAYDGDENYTTDGSTGQVMVYQPVFYYKVIPLILDGYKIRKAEYYVSEKPLAGFKRHPAFYDTNGNEIDYILLSSYEACIFDANGGSDGTGAYLLSNEQVADYETDKLSSISGATPASNGKQKFTKANAEILAQNRGEGWHIDHILSWSAQQLLALIEIGHFDLQSAVGRGRSAGSSINKTGDADTYSTSTGGNKSSTGNSMRYRWCENLYGNVNTYVGGVSVDNGLVLCGLHYDYLNLYFPTNLTIQHVNSISYISAFAYDPEFDWMFIPCEHKGTSAEPVGDLCYGLRDLSGQTWMVGGDSANPGSYYQRAGLFTIHTGYSGEAAWQGSRLIFVPKAETEAEV